MLLTMVLLVPKLLLNRLLILLVIKLVSYIFILLKCQNVKIFFCLAETVKAGQKAAEDAKAAAGKKVDEVKAAAGDAADSAKKAAEKVKDAASDAAGSAKKAAENVADQASSKYRIFIIYLFAYIASLFRTR